MCYVLCISSLLSYIHRNYRNYSLLYQHFKTFISKLLLSSNELVYTFKVVPTEFLIFKYSHFIKNNLWKANEIMLIMSIKVKRRDFVQIFFINLFNSVSCINASITNWVFGRRLVEFLLGFKNKKHFKTSKVSHLIS